MGHDPLLHALVVDQDIYRLISRSSICPLNAPTRILIKPTTTPFTMTTPYSPHGTDDKKLSTEHLERGDDTENAFDEKHHAGNKKKGVNTQLDDAAQLLAAHGGHVDYTPEENKRVLRMVDLYVCVPVSQRPPSSPYNKPALTTAPAPHADVYRLLATTARQIQCILRCRIRPARIHRLERHSVLVVDFRSLCRSIGLPAFE